MTEIQERSILSSDNKHELFCRVYLPEGEPKGLFHTVHGMTEHISRKTALSATASTTSATATPQSRTAIWAISAIGNGWSTTSAWFQLR